MRTDLRPAPPGSAGIEAVTDRIICADSRDLSFIPDSSVHCVVTSPPYGTMKFGYELEQYLAMLRSVLDECVRVLLPDGKLCINVNNYVTSKQDEGSRYIVPITRYVQEWLEAKLVYQDEIFWFKNLPVHGKRLKPLFGSYPFPPNFLMQQRVEYILVYRKEGVRPSGVTEEQKAASKLSTEEWRLYTQNLWQMQSVQNDSDHPAKFPLELPLRLIKLYTFVGDVVLDPFVGSGTTAVAARRLRRHFIGVDIEPAYVELARRNVAQLPLL